ncbi:hypothetical protein G7A79_17420 [Coprococcus sp. MSK.21.13]|nr:hypothetical protein [Clostridium cochlearium]NSJ90919.1 hypothetical protein [Coprococcus sp. MSK.21.13]
MIPTTEIIDETKLVEIKDKKILMHVNNLIPGAFQTGTTMGNAIRSNSQVLYQAVIPVGAKLTESQEMAGAVRGIYHGADGIRGHANLIATNSTANVIANTTSSVMGLGSMIVGQYYMDKINTELTAISEGIYRIAKFQNNEYKSKVFALVAQIKKVSTFQFEILEDEGQRGREIINLNNLEHKCIELLGQANLIIADYYKKSNVSFDEYEEDLLEVQNWYIYQKTLLEVLYRIADLKHTLYLGSISKEQCYSLLNVYSAQVKESVSKLAKWHNFQVEKHGINTNDNVRKRVGIDGLIHKVPGIFKEDYNYRPLSKKTKDIITTQINSYETSHSNQIIDLFQEDVKVIAKEGKFYYLPKGDMD